MGAILRARALEFLVASMLLKGARLATFDPPRVDDADLRVEGERIVERGRPLASGSGEDVQELEGALVMPGLVNAHTHLYSALARGMPGPASAPRSFVEILQRVWWKLDRALDAESVRLSGLVGAIEAARSGTTMLIDHHSSPSFIRGSLGALQGALEEVGLRSALCYEVTDRNGPEGRDLGIEENVTFARERATVLARGLVGAHASFTLGDESLEMLARAVSDTAASTSTWPRTAPTWTTAARVTAAPSSSGSIGAACSPRARCSPTAST